MRGTGDLYALARAVIGVSKAKDGTLKIDPESNYFEGDPFAVALEISPSVREGATAGQKRRATFSYLGQAREADATRADQAVLSVLRDAPQPMTKTEIRAAIPMDAHVVDAAVGRLHQRDTISPISYRPPDKRQASDRWMTTKRIGDFVVVAS